MATNTPEQIAREIAGLEALAGEYVDKANAAWWPGSKKDYMRIAGSCWASIERLKREGGAAS